MSDETTKALINNLPAILGAIAAVIAAIGVTINTIRTGKLKTQVHATEKQNDKIEAKVDRAISSSAQNAAALTGLHEAVNGQTQQLLAVTGAAEHAKGVLEDKTRSDAVAADLADRE